MQAARGTSLSHDDSSLTESGHRPSLVLVRVILVAVFASLYAADQLTKWLAVDRLTGQPDHAVVGDLLVSAVGGQHAVIHRDSVPCRCSTPRATPRTTA